MKAPWMFYEKKLTLFLVLSLICASFSMFSLSIAEVSAPPTSPYIAVIPESTIDPTLTPGKNFTVSIYTDYTNYSVSDVWSWQFSLSYNPDILEGVEVVNGDLITTAKNNTATFIAGTFNNTLGYLKLTVAFFFYTSPSEPYVTSGPGTLANVTFRVRGTGKSNITLGSDTKLIGPKALYTIIDAETEPDHIGHGYFNNVQNIHDVGVTKLVVPATAILGDLVTINVTVANEGNFTETFNVTVYANITLVGTQTDIALTSGDRTTLTFNWNTIGIVEGNYTINASVVLSGDEDPSDNTRAAQIELKTVHDVGIISLEVPTEASIGSLVTINVTVANEGNYKENVTLTVSSTPRRPNPVTTVLSTMNLTLAERPTKETISVIWNTTGVTPASYTINATATIAQDEELGDNIKTKIIMLKLGHDVAIISLSVTPSQVFSGDSVTVTVTVKNLGGFSETFEVKVMNGTSVIGNQSVSLLSGAFSTLSFTWNTTGVAANVYSLEAKAILDGDANQNNNRQTAFVVVKAPTGFVSGIVKDSSTGQPIEGASVAAGEVSVSSGADGFYSVELAPGTYDVTASAGGYQTLSRTGISVVVGQITSLNFTLTLLPTTGFVSGVVKDASTGNTITGASVTADGVSVSTGADGSYSIELAPGTYNITVSAGGYEGSSQNNIIVIAGQTTTINFGLTSVQPPNLLLYGGFAAVAIVIIVGMAVYILKFRKK